MIKEFTPFVESNNIAIRDGKTLLAVSGGIDSVVLAHIFNELELDFGIAHCNFKLRGKESNEDENFVKELASSLDVPFYRQSFETEYFAKSKGVSIQMAARELRYDWFEEVKVKFEYDYVATAHHKGDVVETILFNLAKGTGLDGLLGIKAVRGFLIRPFLFATRVEIEKYAKLHHILWREDRSNKSIKYSRNKIRHQVVPVLEEINPKAQDSIYATSEKIKEAELFIAHSLKKLDKDLLQTKNENTLIDIKLLIEIPGHKYILHQILKPFGFSYVNVIEMANCFSGISGKLFYSKTHAINIDRKYLIVSPIANEDASFTLEKYMNKFELAGKPILTKTFNAKDYNIIKDNNILAMDKDKLRFPIEIRNWKQGDTFKPLGMKGKKKISDFMIDTKIPVNFKNNIKVIVSNGDIVAILEHRLDDRFKITPNTKEVFEITVTRQDV